MNKKKHSIPSYSSLQGDDIRTIPDFYDNLYPSHEHTQSCIIPAILKDANKSKTQRNNKKIKENNNGF